MPEYFRGFSIDFCGRAWVYVWCVRQPFRMTDAHKHRRPRGELLWMDLGYSGRRLSGSGPMQEVPFFSLRHLPCAGRRITICRLILGIKHFRGSAASARRDPGGIFEGHHHDIHTQTALAEMPARTYKYWSPCFASSFPTNPHHPLTRLPSTYPLHTTCTHLIPSLSIYLPWL